MPTIGLKKRFLDSALGSKHSREELEEILFNYGLELDDIETLNIDKEEDYVYKIEVPANRYDLLCMEGLGQALRVFKGIEKPPKYQIKRAKNQIVLKVEKPTREIREFVVAAVLRNVTFDQDSYARFIDLQDKLHQNICRKRTLVSMGTHDLDTITPPFVYKALRPEEIVFVPLNKDKEYNGKDLLDLYLTDSHLKEYVPIIQDKPLYPVIYDSKGVVCSLPPIINSEHSKITLKTKNIFIEATATDLKKAEIVLDTIVTMFSPYCEGKFTVEPVKVVYEDKRIPDTEYPKLSYREQLVDLANVNKKIGINVDADEVILLLERMSLSVEKSGENQVKVTIPPTRQDILHECDVAEDVALAYGYNNIVMRMPETHTVAQPFPLNKLSDQLRYEIATAGWTEVLNFALCSEDDISTKLKREDGLVNAVRIANPKSSEFQVARNTLLPGLLKTLANNKAMPLPIKLFELQDIVVKDSTSDTNSSNRRNAAAIYYSKAGSFEILHGLLDRIMEVLEVKFSTEGERGKLTYYIKGRDYPTFFPGRSADIVLRKEDGSELILGVVGVLHPEVLAKFELNMPCCAMEINIEPFV